MQHPHIILGQILCHRHLSIQSHFIFLPEWENPLQDMDQVHPFLVPPPWNWVPHFHSHPDAQPKNILPLMALHPDQVHSAHKSLLTVGHHGWKHIQLLPCHLP